MLKQVIVLLAVAVFATVTLGQPSLTIVNSPGGGSAGGATVNELIVDTNGADLTNVDLILLPGGSSGCAGCVYQHDTGFGPSPTLNSPSSTDLFLDGMAAPAGHGHDDIKYDSYVTFAGTQVSDTGVFGAPGPHFGHPSKFDNDGVEISYFNTATNDIGNIKIAQLTLGDQVNGGWILAALTAGGARVDITGVIGNGIMRTTTVIPVPAAAWMGMSLLGGLGVTRLVRRKKAA